MNIKASGHPLIPLKEHRASSPLRTGPVGCQCQAPAGHSHPSPPPGKESRTRPRVPVREARPGSATSLCSCSVPGLAAAAEPRPPGLRFLGKAPAGPERGGAAAGARELIPGSCSFLAAAAGSCLSPSSGPGEERPDRPRLLPLRPGHPAALWFRGAGRIRGCSCAAGAPGAGSGTAQ